jgi:hypothetical protein
MVCCYCGEIESRFKLILIDGARADFQTLFPLDNSLKSTEHLELDGFYYFQIKSVCEPKPRVFFRLTSTCVPICSRKINCYNAIPRKLKVRYNQYERVSGAIKAGFAGKKAG